MSPKIQEKLTYFLELFIGKIATLKSLDFHTEANQHRIVLSTDMDELFTENNGEVLIAMQHLLRVLIHKIFPEDRTHFILDAAGFRKHREDTILENISRIAEEKVLRAGRSVVLLGLSGYERLLVHRSLKDFKGIQTQSVGFKQNRKLLILPTSEIGTTGIEDAVILHLPQLISA